MKYFMNYNVIFCSTLMDITNESSYNGHGRDIDKQNEFSDFQL